MSDTYKAACFCGAVELEATGAPTAMGFCHCESCRTWLAAPMNGFTLWPQDQVRITKGADVIATYNKTENSDLKYCTKCGGHVMNDHPGGGLTDVFASLLQGFNFVPAVHVNYAEKTVSMKDGLPKFKDMPTEFGGSGDTLPD